MISPWYKYGSELSAMLIDRLEDRGGGVTFGAQEYAPHDVSRGPVEVGNIDRSGIADLVVVESLGSIASAAELEEIIQTDLTLYAIKRELRPRTKTREVGRILCNDRLIFRDTDGKKLKTDPVFRLTAVNLPLGIGRYQVQGAV